MLRKMVAVGLHMVLKLYVLKKSGLKPKTRETQVSGSRELGTFPGR